MELITIIGTICAAINLLMIAVRFSRFLVLWQTASWGIILFAGIYDLSGLPIPSVAFYARLIGVGLILGMLFNVALWAVKNKRLPIEHDNK